MSVRRTLAATLVAGVLLAGCSDDPEPTFEPPASPSPSESESSSAKPEAQSPEEFIREWFALNTEMQNSGETEAFLAVSLQCDPCSKLAKQVEEIYGAGGSIRLRGQSVERVRRIGSGEFSVVVNAAPTVYTESESAPETRLPGGPNEYRMFLRKRDGAWMISDYLDTPS
jgi:hypothetical protein